MALAQRLLGVRADAEDAVQESWVRLQRHGGAGIVNLPGWLTTVVSRLCLDELRARASKPTRATSWDDLMVLPDPVPGPAEEAELADAVGLALLVVLDALTPPERVALVMHDVFGVPFADVAAVLGRSPDATKMAASRARRKVRSQTAPSAINRDHRRTVEAFLAAARSGDVHALLAVLDPSVVLGVHNPDGHLEIVGAADVAGRAQVFAARSGRTRLVAIADRYGVLTRDLGDSPMSLMIFTVDGQSIVRIDALSDPAALNRLDLDT